MPSSSDTEAAARTMSGADSFEKLRRQQLLIIRKTSIPGVVLGGGALLLLLWAALYWTDSVATRDAYLTIFACGVLMVGLWALSLWECHRDNLHRAFFAQFAASVLTTIALMVFIDRGAVMALVTAFTAVSAGAALLDQRTLRVAGGVITAAVLLAAAAHELKLVHPVAVPPFLLYAATASAVASGFRTPIAALSLFHEHLNESRDEALSFAQAAEQSRRDAAAHARRLEEVTQDLRDFTYVVSHDLRAPLINIEGFSKVLGESLESFDTRMTEVADQPHGGAAALRAAWGDAHAEAVESMHFITRGIEKLNAMVVGLLELSRIDSQPAQEQAVELAPLVQQILESLQHQIRARDIEVYVAPLPTVVADPLRISQVFSNLIENAIKYMPERAPRTISVRAEAGEDGDVFSVSDSGAGISPADRATVFRPFKRLDPKGPTAGEGLGLAAVKKIVERGGGRIWIESPAAGPGTCFRFSWPRATTPAAPSGDAEERRAA